GSTCNKEAGQQDDDREQIKPETQHVEEGEHHIPRSTHQWHKIVSESSQEKRCQQVDHHDHAVHGHSLIIKGWFKKADGVRKTNLQSHQNGKAQCDQSHKDCSSTILDGDYLVILTPDVFGDKAVRIMKRMRIILIG